MRRARRKKKKKKKKNEEVVVGEDLAKKSRGSATTWGTSKKERIASFRRVTGEPEAAARFFLESANFDVDAAFAIWCGEDYKSKTATASDGDKTKTAGIDHVEVRSRASPASKERINKSQEEHVSPEDPEMSARVPKVRCCVCGIMTKPNDSNMCLRCLTPEIDLKSDLCVEDLEVSQCRTCKKYQNKNRIWIAAEWESKELLGLLLKRIKGLKKKKCKLIDACFVFTEPHSRRIKVKMTIQKSIFGDSDSFFRQPIMATFRVRKNMCDACAKESSNANQTWVALVQLRQKHERRGVLEFLEQEILRAEAHKEAIGIRNGASAGGGIDVFFPRNNFAKTFLDFVKRTVPCRATSSKTLVGHDVKSNVHRFQYTHRVDVIPLCKHDLLLLSKESASAFGTTSGLSLVVSITRSIHIMHLPVVGGSREVSSSIFADVSAQSFWKCPVRPLIGVNSLTNFLVLDVAESVTHENRGEDTLVEVEVAPVNSVGDTSFFCMTHLNVKTGDLVKGYSMSTLVVPDDVAHQLRKSGARLPDVVLVKPAKRD